MGCSQCGQTLELRNGFARSGVFVGGGENVTRAPTLATPPAVNKKINHHGRINLEKSNRKSLRR